MVYDAFPFKRLNNDINDSYLLNQINFKVNNYDARNNNWFEISRFSQKHT